MQYSGPIDRPQLPQGEAFTHAALPVLLSMKVAIVDLQHFPARRLRSSALRQAQAAHLDRYQLIADQT